MPLHDVNVVLSPMLKKGRRLFNNLGSCVTTGRDSYHKRGDCLCLCFSVTGWKMSLKPHESNIKVEFIKL